MNHSSNSIPNSMNCQAPQCRSPAFSSIDDYRWYRSCSIELKIASFYFFFFWNLVVRYFFFLKTVQTVHSKFKRYNFWCVLLLKARRPANSLKREKFSKREALERIGEKFTNFHDQTVRWYQMLVLFLADRTDLLNSVRLIAFELYLMGTAASKRTALRCNRFGIIRLIWTNVLLVSLFEHTHRKARRFSTSRLANKNRKTFVQPLCVPLSFLCLIDRGFWTPESGVLQFKKVLTKKVLTKKPSNLELLSKACRSTGAVTLEMAWLRLVWRLAGKIG